METQRNSLSWGRWSLLLLLLGLAMPMPPTAAQAMSYQEAVRLAVQGFNQRSLEASLYRLLQLEPQPQGDPNPFTPKPVSFTLKETVCPRTTRRPPEECDFKENGLVKECAGAVTLDPDDGFFDVTCDEIRNVKFNARKLGELIRRGGEGFGRKVEKIGRRIKEFFTNLAPREEEA
ncbi:cathelicidin antimicrobial peptide [Eptesicus fuscus]|uniref:cathelicidin antimicrobial peptide n=1 Tax=Eptesicus fuscus TaxID=29078 RepID=UPI00046B9635|nr:cathelicidin antimicrobial peptide [Eptesicus fuscus]